ncbi:MAG: tetratricopeptide repeat protein [Pyrinomonadaceae bacterium]|nr:tetratricopeptide repeat protein [Pyrinomonadaceae bacterium]
MNKNFRQIVFSIALIAGGFALIFALSNFLERHISTLPKGFEDEDLSVQGANLKNYSLGFEGLLADWYWMKALQYLGKKFLDSKEDVSLENLTPLNPRLLYPYLDNATTLDPKFISVYEYGAVVLPAIDKEQAIKLTEKGIRDNPNNWRLRHYLGFIYWRLGNYQKAAEVYEEGAKITGAPLFMRQMAAKMNSDGGSRETARAIYRQMFEESEDRQTRENAALRLLRLDFLDEQEIIQKSLDDFKRKNNRCANNWREIMPFLQAAKIPDAQKIRVDNQANLIDRSGAAYLLNKEICRAELDAARTKIPLE